MEVGDWLESLGLGQYARAFAENDVDPTILDQLTDADLNELGEYEAMNVHLEREMRLIGTLGARGFEAQNLEMQGRLLLDCHRNGQAIKALREALAICGEVGMQFSGPKTDSALSRAVHDKAERDRLLAGGEELLQRGAVGHNHLWFYRDAIEAMLAAGDAEGALRYVAMLNEYTRPEPLPWSQLFIARGRALARVLQGFADETVKDELDHIRTALVGAGLKAFLAPVEDQLRQIAFAG